MNKLISIIVPIYRVENYLKRCIDSIINQTYKHIEIILVDDGSPDNCGAICDEYTKFDDRIKVIHKKNGGLSDARNCGIEISTGDYIIFIDGDDYVSKNMCEKLLIRALEHNADIVSCNFKEIYIDNNREKINKQSIKKSLEVYTNLEVIYKYFLDYTIDINVVWNKLYKRDIFFKDISVRFPKGKLHEDDYIVCKLYYYANKIVIINDVLYYYIRRFDSITGNFSEKNILDTIDARIEYYNFVNNKEIKLKYMVQAHGIDYYKYCLSFELSEKINEKINDFRKCILKNKKNIFKNPYMNWKKYIKFILICINANWILRKL